MTKEFKRASKLAKTLHALTMSRILPRSTAAGYYRVPNFGDMLTPDILRYFDVRPFSCPRLSSADMVGVGSILHMLPSSYSGVILGSGLIDEKSAKQFPYAEARLVRGYLTRKLCSFSKSVPVGDPGLISDTVYSRHLSGLKEWDIGIVPHYKDLDDEALATLLKKTSGEIQLINVRMKPREVVHAISRCRIIISSSLHGLIVADSLGIPNSWIKISNSIIGGSFKFNDYYSCFGTERNPIDIGEVNDLRIVAQSADSLPDSTVRQVKDAVFSAFSEFCSKL